MNVRCAVPECQVIFETNEFALGAKFICKNHTRREQMLAAGRTYAPVKSFPDARDHFQSVCFDPEITKLQEEFWRLRLSLDGKDKFMEAHQMIKTSGATLHAERLQDVPEWTFNDLAVRKLLLTAFPKLNHDSDVGKRQRTRAARWATILYWYFRHGWTDEKIAEELGESLSKVHGTLKAIKRVHAGKAADGRGIRGKLGRPKKVMPIYTPLVRANTNDESIIPLSKAA